MPGAQHCWLSISLSRLYKRSSRPRHRVPRTWKKHVTLAPKDQPSAQDPGSKTKGNCGKAAGEGPQQACIPAQLPFQRFVTIALRISGSTKHGVVGMTGPTWCRSSSSGRPWAASDTHATTETRKRSTPSLMTPCSLWPVPKVEASLRAAGIRFQSASNPGHHCIVPACGWWLPGDPMIQP